MEHDYAASTRFLRTVQAGLIVLAALGTVLLIRFFMLLVIRPVSELHAGIRRMASNDLAIRLPVKTDDELGELANGFNGDGRTPAGGLWHAGAAGRGQDVEPRRTQSGTGHPVRDHCVSQ